jgi:hypothetical protein
MELKAESRAESGFPQGTLLPNIRSPGPTRLTVQHISIQLKFFDVRGARYSGGSCSLYPIDLFITTHVI